MLDTSADKLEIFVALALGRADKKLAVAVDVEPADEIATDGRISPIIEHLTDPESKNFKRLLAEFEGKAEAEKTVERKRILRRVGTDQPSLIDKNVHRSHIGEALRKEIPAIQQIIGASLISAKSSTAVRTSEITSPLRKTVCGAFFGQFASLKDISQPTAFDRLSSTQLVRLIRLAGIREVALACYEIEEVESVAAFLRRFTAEDARAIAVQLNDLRDVSEARSAFAESLVQATLERKPQPSEMLDLLGIRLVGILLCESDRARIAYTSQKLPLEITPKLTEIIDQCRKMTKNLQRKIISEIEYLAEAVARTAGEKRPVRTRRKQN